MSDIDQLLSVNETERVRRADLVEQAAGQAGWHRPAEASRLIDPAGATTPAQATEAVHRYQREHPEVARPAEPAPITPEEQERIWGQSMLDGLLGGGRQ